MAWRGLKNGVLQPFTMRCNMWKDIKKEEEDDLEMFFIVVACLIYISRGTSHAEKRTKCPHHTLPQSSFLFSFPFFHFFFYLRQ